MDKEKVADSGIIEKFRNRALQWWRAMEGVENLPIPQNHPLYKKKAEIMKDAFSIRSKLELLPGMDQLFSTALGAYPLLIGGAVAAAAGWAYAYFNATEKRAQQLAKEWAVYNEVKGKTGDPEKALKAMLSSKTKEPKSWSDVAYKGLSLLPWVVGGYILWKGYRIFIK